MWKFVQKHGIGFLAGAGVGFAVGSFTAAGAAVKQFVMGPAKPGATADNVVSTK